MQADWVYRGMKFRLGGDLGDEEEATPSGTYYSPFNMTAGQGGQTAQVLYDSAAYMGGRYGQGIDPASGDPMAYAINPQARPDTPLGGALIHGVDMTLNLWINAGWVTTAHVYLGWRIVVAEQDPYTGQMLIHPLYSMWVDMAGLNAQPAVWANGRQNCAEGRLWRDFNQNADVQPNFVIERRLRFKRRLQEDEALFLYLELHPSSLGLTLVNPWCRTLVTDTRA